MDLIDRLRTYASTRKGELAELITEAADALERQTCEDAVSRANGDFLSKGRSHYFHSAAAEHVDDGHGLDVLETGCKWYESF